jgi:hypothetical protein
MADLKYYDGTQWITLKGPGVDLTSAVGVDTTDCDIGPADSTGSLTKDGAEVDGVQSYKLDLSLPRPPVVTTSDGVEPAAACDGDLWVDESEGGVLKVKNGVEWVVVSRGNSATNRQAWGTWAGTFGTGSATDENGKLKSEGISSVVYISLGCYDVFFDEPFPDDKYCWVGQAGHINQNTPVTTVSGIRTGVIAPERLRVFTSYIINTQTYLVDFDSICVIIFDRID